MVYDSTATIIFRWCSTESRRTVWLSESSCWSRPWSRRAAGVVLPSSSCGIDPSTLELFQRRDRSTEVENLQRQSLEMSRQHERGRPCEIWFTSWFTTPSLTRPVVHQSRFCIGAATARVARVRTLPTSENPEWIRPILCSKVLIHYNLDPTIFSTPAVPLHFCHTVILDPSHVLQLNCIKDCHLIVLDMHDTPILFICIPSKM